MFDIGFTELMLLAVIGLLVLGPERLPRVARTLGHWLGRARMAFNNMKNELEREAHNADMQEKFRKQLEEMGLTEEDLQRGKEDILPPGDIPGRDQAMKDERKDSEQDDDARSGDDSGKDQDR